LSKAEETNPELGAKNKRDRIKEIRLELQKRRILKGLKSQRRKCRFQKIIKIMARQTSPKDNLPCQIQDQDLVQIDYLSFCCFLFCN
jgi:hypothetical protein